MNYDLLIKKGLTTAFIKLESLAVEVTLTKKASLGFNFTSAATEETEEMPVVTKMIVTERAKRGKQTNTLTQKVLLKTADVGDVSTYDKLTVNSVQWNIGSTIVSNGYVTLLELSKEV